MNKIGIVESLIEDFFSGNIDKITGYLTEDVEWRVAIPDSIPIGGVFIGPSAVLQFFQEHQKMLKMKSDDSLKVISEGDTVMFLGHECAYILPENALYEADYVMVFQFRGDKICKCYAFGDSAALVAGWKG